MCVDVVLTSSCYGLDAVYRRTLFDPLQMPLAAPDGNDRPVRVVGGVMAPVLLLFMEAPVGVEVPTAPQGAEPEHGFGPRQAPAGPRAVHPG